MSNQNRLNATAFNASTASLALVSAAAAFSGGVLTTDFSGGSYAIKASASLSGGGQTNFESGLKTSLLNANLVGISDNNFQPSVNRSGGSDWVAEMSTGFNATGQFVGAGDWTGDGQFFANTEFKVGEGAWVSTSDLESIGNRVDFLEADWSSIPTLVNDGTLQIEGLMVGAWSNQSSLWSGSTLDTGAGFITHDGFGFMEVDGSWENASFLTALFTTGGFISSGAQIEILGTRVIDAGQTQWVHEIEFTATPDSNQVGQMDLTHTADLDMVAVREIFPIGGDWAVDSVTFQGKALMSYYGKWSRANTTAFLAISKSELAGRMNLAPESDLTLGQALIWKKASTAWTAKGSSSIKSQKVRPGIAELTTTFEAEFVGERTIWGFVNMTGLGATLNTGGVLRLVDAPLFRQFRVPKQNRVFSVSNNNKKFEVAS